MEEREGVGDRDGASEDEEEEEEEGEEGVGEVRRRFGGGSGDSGGE